MNVGLGKRAEDAALLRLVPFPKEVKLEAGSFRLARPLVVEAALDVAEAVGRVISEEMECAGLQAPVVREKDAGSPMVRVLAESSATVPSFSFRDGSTDEDYVLRVQPNAVTVCAKAAPGLLHGVATLRQLIRANRREGGLSCVSVRDWPALRWRCLSDDITRGPSSTLDTLKFEIATGAFLKLNMFTYYMEHQYAFKKHSVIVPKDGALTPEELRQLVAYAKPLHVEIMGNQQSFGHFDKILKHKEYEHLRESPHVLCPVNEESYRLLDDLYSEVCPILPFPFFNICCDETYSLGWGPSKKLVEEVGLGKVYLRHIRRVHELLTSKYQKRVVMWGDVVLQHPEIIKDIPKDIIMGVWWYQPEDSFEDRIMPFAEAGFDFFICPGISNWGRVYPDYGSAMINIRNFVRDGVKHGASGMINCSWEDDGENLKGNRWHGYAWGAECAWNASQTEPEAFNRRIGAVLFGEPGDHFGRAIELLAEALRLPDEHGKLELHNYSGMSNRRLWDTDFGPMGCDAEARRAYAERLLALVRPAIDHLKSCRDEATVNADTLDHFLFGARRVERMAEQMLGGLEAAGVYQQACEGPRDEAGPQLARVGEIIVKNYEAHEALAREFERLWLAKCKPYALEWTLRRYEEHARKCYHGFQSSLHRARRAAEAGQPLPHPRDLGLGRGNE